MPKFAENTEDKLKTIETSLANLKKTVADYGSPEGESEDDKEEGDNKCCCEIEQIKCCICDISNILYEMKWAVEYLKDEVRYMSAQFNNHLDKHLPPAPSASHMKTAIEKLGWDDEYEVQAPRVVYASASRGGSFEVEIAPKAPKK